MKKLNLVLTTVVILVLSGCGSSSDDSYSGNYGGVSGANAAGTTTSSSIYTNGEDDQELTDTLLIDLLGNPESAPKDTNTTEEVTPTTSTTNADIFTTKTVGYLADTNTLPTCFNTEETILEYNTTPKFTCEWYCGVYDGDGPIHVRLTFLKVNDIWTLTEEDLSTASSQCHN
jgi:uncharacterized protein YceK